MPSGEILMFQRLKISPFGMPDRLAKVLKNTKVPGIYRSRFQLVRHIILISLNELSNEPYNAFVKCFATHRQEKQKAFDSLEQSGLLNSSTNELKWFILGLKGLWFTDKGDDMNLEMTPEQVAQLGKIWGDAFLSSLSVEELLENIKV
jgi:hypothetical protein